MTSLLLDTHIWIWFQANDGEYLRKSFAKELVEYQREGRLYVSAASVWEIAVAVSKNRLYLGASVEDWVEEGLRDGGLQLLALTPRILIDSTRLPGTIHKDPGDRMLIATAREQNLTLVTRDDHVLRYGKQGHVKTARR